MPHELVYTSAPRGLHAAAGGYCTVAETPGLPAPLAAQLQRLSAYAHRVPGRAANPAANPTAYAHTLVGRHRVVSRVADAGFDHTGRTNFLAHHIALAEAELPAGGPARLCGQRGVFLEAWTAEEPPRLLPADRRLPGGSGDPRRCRLWERHAGDAGWAGMLAAAHAGREPAYVLFEPGQPVLDFLAEALALVPPARRWQVTFNTYYAAGGECQWRCVPADSAEAREALAGRRLVLRVDRPMDGDPTGPLVEAARTGVVPAHMEPTPVPVARAADRSAAVPIPVSAPARTWHPTADRDDGGSENTSDVVSASGEAAFVKSRRGSPAKPLLLGLAFGAALAAVAICLFEVAAERSLLRLVGVVGKPEREAVAEKEQSLRDSDSAAIAAGKDRTRAQAEHETALSAERAARAAAEAAVSTKQTAWDAERTTLAARAMAAEAANRTAQSQLTIAVAERDAAESAKTAAKGDAAQLRTELDNAKADAKKSASPMPYITQVGVPPGLSAKLEWVTPPLGATLEAGGLKVGTETGRAKTEPDTGKFFIEGLHREVDTAHRCVWSAAVVRIQLDGQPVRYVQLAPPRTVSGIAKRSMSDPTLCTVRLFDEEDIAKNPKLGQASFAVLGKASVTVDGRKVAFTPSQSDGPSNPLPKSEGYELGMQGGEVRLRSSERFPEGCKVVVTVADIVLAQKSNGPDAYPVIFRVQP